MDIGCCSVIGWRDRLSIFHIKCAGRMDIAGDIGFLCVVTIGIG